MNDQPPAGEKIRNIHFPEWKTHISAPIISFLSLFPFSFLLHASQHTLKFSRPSAGQIPYSRFFPNSGSLFPFFSQTTPTPLLSGLGEFCGSGNKQKIRTYAKYHRSGFCSYSRIHRIPQIPRDWGFGTKTGIRNQCGSAAIFLGVFGDISQE